MARVPSSNHFKNSDENNRPIIAIPSTQKDLKLFSDSFAVTPHSQLESTVRLINSEFEAMGYTKILKIEAGQLEVIMSNFVEGVLRLISSYRNSLDNCKKTELRCQQELDKSIRLNILAKLEQKQMLRDKESLSYLLKRTSDTLDRIRVAFSKHQAQCSNQKRRLEIQRERLRKRLVGCLKEASFGYRRGRKNHSPTISTDLSTSEIRSRVEGDKVSNAYRSNTNQLSIHDNTSPPRSCPPSVVSKASLTKQLSSGSLPPTNAADNETSRDDLSSTVIQQLESRLKELCHENRELRDFASQLSSRMFQFSDFLEHNCDLCMQDNANISFDCQDEHHSLGESHVAEHDISEVQSFDEKRNLFKKSIDKQSTPVIDFSFELPFRVIRDDLIKRVQYASWVVWSKLKCLARCHTNSVKETPGFKSQFCHTDNSLTVECVDSDKVHVEDDDEVNQLGNQLSQLKSSLADCEHPQS